jgi:Transposase.
LEALKENQTIVDIAERYQVHPNQITEWKKQLLEHAKEVFSKDRKPDQWPYAKDIHSH